MKKIQTIWKKKTCRVCKAKKWLKDFPTHRDTRDGRHTYCRDCMRDYNREWSRKKYGCKPRVRHDPTKPKVCARCKIEKQPEDFPSDSSRRGALHSYCRICRQEDARERHRRYHAEGKAAVWNLARSARKHGLTIDDIFVMLKKQKEVCAICNGPASGNHGRLVIDHDHKTGIVRGMLCGKCNGILGLASDNPDIFKMCIKYLKKKRTKP